MKLLVLILSSVVVPLAMAGERKLVDCTVVEVVNSSYLEESLSVEEYPDVELTEDQSGAKEFWLGSSLYSENDGDTITGENTVGFDKSYTIYPSHQLEQYSVLVTGHPMSRVGKISARNRDNKTDKYGEWELIARLKCK